MNGDKGDENNVDEGNKIFKAIGIFVVNLSSCELYHYHLERTSVSGVPYKDITNIIFCVYTLFTCSSQKICLEMN